jgi:hypothetical protein
MRPGGGKQKGSAFEREVCKRLSLWVTSNRRSDVFWRSAMSGGRATIHGTQVQQCGDICAVAREGYQFAASWFVECKHVRKLGIDSFLINGTGELARFWKLARKLARQHSRNPMIIACQNRMPVIVVTKRHALLHICPPIVVCAVADIYLFEDWMEKPNETQRRVLPRRKHLDQPKPAPAGTQPSGVGARGQATRTVEAVAGRRAAPKRISQARR